MSATDSGRITQLEDSSPAQNDTAIAVNLATCIDSPKRARMFSLKTPVSR